MVWHYEKGWVPYEEDKKHRLSERRTEDYCREINKAHSVNTLRNLQDRIVLDDQLGEGDKLRLGNTIMDTWKFLVNNGHNGRKERGVEQ